MVSTPDIIENHFPFYCTCCGEDLSSEPGLFSGKRQVIDIPPIIPIVTEHQLFNKLCKCGHMNQSSYPLGVKAPVSYGVNVQALIAYFSTRQLVPIKRTSEIFTDVFAIPVSTGGVDYILNKVKNKAAFIAIHPNRGYKAIEQIMPEGFQNNILVTDCWASYFKTNALSHQLCTSHLLRELQYLKERYKNSTWAERMSLLIVYALELRKTDNITKANADEVFRSLRDLINEPINSAFKEVIPFRKRMIK